MLAFLVLFLVVEMKNESVTKQQMCAVCFSHTNLRYFPPTGAEALCCARATSADPSATSALSIG